MDRLIKRAVPPIQSRDGMSETFAGSGEKMVIRGDEIEEGERHDRLVFVWNLFNKMWQTERERRKLLERADNLRVFGLLNEAEECLGQAELMAMSIEARKSLLEPYELNVYETTSKIADNPIDQRILSQNRFRDKLKEAIKETEQPWNLKK